MRSSDHHVWNRERNRVVDLGVFADQEKVGSGSSVNKIPLKSKCFLDIFNLSYNKSINYIDFYMGRKKLCAIFL